MDRKRLRQQVYTALTTVVQGRGGDDITESRLLQMWPQYLDVERAAAKPTLSLADVAAMLEGKQTPQYHAMRPRDLSEAELAVISAWHAKAQAEEREKCGDALAAVQGSIMAQAAANKDEVMAEIRTVRRAVLNHGADQTKSVRQMRADAAELERKNKVAELRKALACLGLPLPEDVDDMSLKAARDSLKAEHNGMTLAKAYKDSLQQAAQRETAALEANATLRRETDKLNKDLKRLRQEEVKDLSLEAVRARQREIAAVVDAQKASNRLARKRTSLAKKLLSLGKQPIPCETEVEVDAELQKVTPELEARELRKWQDVVRQLFGSVDKPLATNFEELDLAELKGLAEQAKEEGATLPKKRRARRDRARASQNRGLGRGMRHKRRRTASPGAASTSATEESAPASPAPSTNPGDSAPPSSAEGKAHDGDSRGSGKSSTSSSDN